MTIESIKNGMVSISKKLQDDRDTSRSCNYTASLFDYGSTLGFIISRREVERYFKSRLQDECPMLNECSTLKYALEPCEKVHLEDSAMYIYLHLYEEKASNPREVEIFSRRGPKFQSGLPYLFAEARVFQKMIE